MDGEIGVVSEVERGSIFWFTAKFIKQESERIKIRPKIKFLGKKLRVLILDDNKTNRMVLAKQMANWKINFYEAESVFQAMDILEQHAQDKKNIDIVFTDMQLPDLDGLSFGNKVKKDERFKDTHLIMMTSIGKRGDAAILQDAGFDAFLSKPFKLTLLKDY